MISTSYPCWDKEPSPALRAPSPILRTGEGKAGESIQLIIDLAFFLEDLGPVDDQLVQVPIAGANTNDRVLVDGGVLDYARLTADDQLALLLRNGTTFSVFDAFGDRSLTIRGSGAEPLSADVRS